MTQKKQKAKIGDIIAIPIYPEKIFVFGRLLEDASIEVFSRVSDSPNIPDDLTLSKVILSAGFFDKKVKAGEWGSMPFSVELDFKAHAGLRPNFGVALARTDWLASA